MQDCAGERNEKGLRGRVAATRARLPPSGLGAIIEIGAPPAADRITDRERPIRTRMCDSGGRNIDYTVCMSGKPM